MVLELKVTHGKDLASLQPLIPVLISYILSFIYIGIYWNNHHHLLHTVTNVSGGVLLANLHLLFWLSLVPFVTGWMGENHFAPIPVALYGIVLLMAAIAFFILQSVILKKQGKQSILAKAIGKDLKGKISPILYVFGIFSTWFSPVFAGGIYALVAFIWLIPDQRIERILNEESDLKE
jgi:uncharacterized membrane protein